MVVMARAAPAASSDLSITSSIGSCPYPEVDHDDGVHLALYLMEQRGFRFAIVVAVLLSAGYLGFWAWLSLTAQDGEDAPVE
jgi:hypothetical protein